MKPTLLNRLIALRASGQAMIDSYSADLKGMRRDLCNLRKRQEARKKVVSDLLALCEDMRREIERLETK